MKYLLQNYADPDIAVRLSEDERQAILDEYLAIRECPACSAAGSSRRPRARRPCASRTARRCSRTARSSTRRSTSAAISCSSWTTSTRRPRSRRGSRRRGWAARSRCGRWWRGSRLLEQVFRDEWGRVLATLVGFLGDFDLAEEAAQEAFAVAAERWPRDGTPPNPGAWLTITARNRAIDRLRRDRTLAEKTRLLEVPEAVEDEMDETSFPTSGWSWSSRAAIRRWRSRRRSR